MSYRAYIPKRGDLAHMNFSPSAGHEMADRHYTLVLSSLVYNCRSRMCVVCPITSRVKGWPFEVPVPSGLLPPKAGVGEVQSVIVADAVRQVDYRQREMAFVAEAPREVVEEVLDVMLSILEDESA
jgi:mRNA interferase MazF